MSLRNSFRPLSPSLRSFLAKTVLEARRTAEAAGHQSLQNLAVDRPEPYASMSLAEKALRNRLRARGRQVGDRHDRATRVQEIGRLIHEVAYEQWHRMLFARFLAANRLLVEPESGVPVSLDEVRDLARRAAEDPWALAGQFAQQMLPGVFRRDDPVLEVVFSPEAQLRLDELVESLPNEVFLANDSLGWTYQFWQAERKDQVNRSEVKIGAEELPAVTQLFTEHYMVLFLFHNTIGAWRAARWLSKHDKGKANWSEDDLRQAVRIEAGRGYDFPYLRFVRDEHQVWRPAAGEFEKWPRATAELRLLDPCCGSGHFLVEALELLTALRVEEEQLSVREAVCGVLRDNIHALEIDPRCTQIAAFNLALAAWRMVGHAFKLPRLNVACCGLAPNCTESEWMAVATRAEMATGMEGRRDLFGSEPTLATGPLHAAMEAFHVLFRQSPVLGSLINPEIVLGDDFFRMNFDGVRQMLSVTMEQENRRSGEVYERTVIAREMAQSAEALSGTYTMVITNVPYLLRRKQSRTLQAYIADTYPDSKNDLATAFLERSFQWLGANGTQAVVSPQAWLQLTSYRSLRRTLLHRRTWNLIARLGTGAFGSIGGHVVNVILGIFSADPPSNTSRISGLALSQSTAGGKAQEVSSRRLTTVLQKAQLKNVDTRVMLGPSSSLPLLMLVAEYGKGSMTGDRPRFVLCHWEVPVFPQADQVKWLNSPTSRDHWSGRSQFCKVSLDSPSIRRQRGSGINGHRVFGRTGIAVHKVTNLRTTLYAGEVFDDNLASICPRQSDIGLTKAFWAYLSHPNYVKHVREIDEKWNVTCATLVKVPFDLEHWRKVGDEQYPYGLPDPYSDDPIQWLFHGHPCGSVVWDENTKRLADGPFRIDSTVLQVAVARLLGYRWPPEHDATMHLADESSEWVRRSSELIPLAGKDGIVCIPPVGGERSAQDRIRELLAAAYGSEWSVATERALLASSRDTGRAPASIGDWLRGNFFEQHCRLFHNRPFVWHIWDGRSDGFAALVNYHRLAGPDGEGRRTLESLTYRYLGDWIERQRADQQEGKAGADARLAAALDLQVQLERIATGEPPLDIFVRWRPLHRQPIGWEPTLDDGVRLNIRPFMRAELRRGGRAGAGILRWKPNIKWGKDRGKEPEYDKDTGQHVRPSDDFPWFWSCPDSGTERQRTDFMGGPAFDGNRWNDLHYTRAAKEAAREAAARRDSVQPDDPQSLAPVASDA